MPFVVLFVCAGNVCRSPTAELIFNSLTRGDLMRSASSGLHALPGEPIYGPTILALHERGVDAHDHRARLFVPGMAARADLILTAERGQRDRVMSDAPQAFRRIFTVKEFLDCATPTSDQVGTLIDLQQIVIRAAHRRSQRGPVTLEQDEIRDAYGQSEDIARAVVAEIYDLILQLSRLLAVGRPSPRPRAAPATRRPRPRSSGPLVTERTSPRQTSHPVPRPSPRPPTPTVQRPSPNTSAPTAR